MCLKSLKVYKRQKSCIKVQFFTFMLKFFDIIEIQFSINEI